MLHEKSSIVRWHSRDVPHTWVLAVAVSSIDCYHPCVSVYIYTASPRGLSTHPLLITHLAISHRSDFIDTHCILVCCCETQCAIHARTLHTLLIFCFEKCGTLVKRSIQRWWVSYLFEKPWCCFIYSATLSNTSTFVKSEPEGTYKFSQTFVVRGPEVICRCIWQTVKLMPDVSWQCYMRICMVKFGISGGGGLTYLVSC